jgi:hypothetical protein
MNPDGWRHLLRLYLLARYSSIHALLLRH